MLKPVTLAVAIAISGCSTNAIQNVQTEANWIRPVTNDMVPHKVYPESSTLTRTIFNYVDRTVPRSIVQPVFVNSKGEDFAATLEYEQDPEVEVLKRKIERLEKIADDLQRQLDGKPKYQHVIYHAPRHDSLSTMNATSNEQEFTSNDPVSTKIQVSNIEADIVLEKNIDSVLPPGGTVNYDLINRVDVVAIFNTKQEASNLVSQLEGNGDSDYFVSSSSAKAEWYVYMGRYNSLGDAGKRVEQLTQMSVTGITLTTNLGRLPSSLLV
jgi:hypothetical protein